VTLTLVALRKRSRGALNKTVIRPWLPFHRRSIISLCDDEFVTEDDDDRVTLTALCP
jgi:hypothetical protein